MIPVTMMMAITLDGKIAKNSDHFPDWTSKEDKKLFSKISKEHGVVMMGAKTFATFPAPLPERLNVVFTLEKNPPKIEGVKWVTGEPELILEELEKMGYKSALLGGGAFLNTLFLEKKLIKKIILTIEPKVFGDGISLFNKDFNINLKLLDLQKINEDAIMVKYEVIYE
ncbi:MAG: dihydrofolate reductase family protein [Patescibacteria group bacterium]|jgi:dihydrofolate reductase